MLRPLCYSLLVPSGSRPQFGNHWFITSWWNCCVSSLRHVVLAFRTDSFIPCWLLEMTKSGEAGSSGNACILEFSFSFASRDPSYLEWGSSWFSSVTCDKEFFFLPRYVKVVTNHVHASTCWNILLVKLRVKWSMGHFLASEWLSASEEKPNSEIFQLNYESSVVKGYSSPLQSSFLYNQFNYLFYFQCFLISERAVLSEGSQALPVFVSCKSRV